MKKKQEKDNKKYQERMKKDEVEDEVELEENKIAETKKQKYKNRKENER